MIAQLPGQYYVEFLISLCYKVKIKVMPNVFNYVGY